MDDRDKINLQETNHKLSIQKTEKYVLDQQKIVSNALRSEEQKACSEFYAPNIHNSPDIIVPSTSENCHITDKTIRANENVV